MLHPRSCLAPFVLAAALPVTSQQFENALATSGIRFRHEASKTPRKYLPETMGGGVALLDVNTDGRIDVFFVNGAELAFPHPQGAEPSKSDPKYWNRLYINRGGMRFEDATEQYGVQGRGYGMGAAVGDYDNDGDPDLLVTNVATGDVPAAVLYRNDAGMAFTDVSRESGIDAQGWATSAGFFDAENDGDLDLLILRYMQWGFSHDNRCGMEASYGRSYCHPDLFPPESSLFYRNNGDGTFTDATESSGIGAYPGKGLGLAFADFDTDGWIDIAVANDSHPQFLFRNRRDGTFVEQALISGTAYDSDGDEFAGMGILFDDLDQDGQPDLLVTTLSQERFALFFGMAEGQFDYSTGRSGLGPATQLFAGWGLATFDADADASLEVFFANGHVMDTIEYSQPHVSYRQSPLLFKLVKRRMVNISETAGSVFAATWASRGTAVGDLDGNGLPDILVSNLDGAPYLARNTTETQNQWVGVALLGCESSRDGIGSRLVLDRPSGATQYRTVTRSGSYLSARDPRAFFGVGEDEGDLRLEVHWPSGKTSVEHNLQVGKVNVVSESADCMGR